jgi:hypothetical protein
MLQHLVCREIGRYTFFVKEAREEQRTSARGAAGRSGMGSLVWEMVSVAARSVSRASSLL